MTIHRFFVSPNTVDEKNGVILCQSEKMVRQIRKVLRLENGDRLDVVDGQGNIYHCILQEPSSAKRDFVQAKIVGKETVLDPTDNFIVAMPLIKASRFEWALEKLTELGANKIVPIASERSILKEASSSKTKRWIKIIEEAAEQCERSRIAELSPPFEFLEWLEQPIKDPCLRLICIERSPVQPIEEVLYNFRMKGHNRGAINCAIAIGAEGGFTEMEIEGAIKQNFVPVSLGNNILRSETAAIFALSTCKSWLSAHIQ